MEQYKIVIVKELARDFNQYNKSSLQPAIQEATDCDFHQAMSWGLSHCNLLSWYFGLIASGKINMMYAEYFKKLLDNKCCTEAGQTLLTKDKIAPICFGFKMEVNYLTDWNNIVNTVNLDPASFYQLRIINSSHYMCSWVGSGKLMIADTHDRGIDVPAIGANRVDAAHFDWLLKI